MRSSEELPEICFNRSVICTQIFSAWLSAQIYRWRPLIADSIAYRNSIAVSNREYGYNLWIESITRKLCLSGRLRTYRPIEGVGDVVEVLIDVGLYQIDEECHEADDEEPDVESDDQLFPLTREHVQQDGGRSEAALTLQHLDHLEEAMKASQRERSEYEMTVGGVHPEEGHRHHYQNDVSDSERIP